MNGRKPVILCVDDEQSVLVCLKEQLERAFGQAYAVETADDAAGALELHEELLGDGHDVPVLITDHIMPGMKGDALIRELQARAPKMLEIMLTGQAGTEAVGNAVNSGGLYRHVTKPWQQDDLVLTVREALRRHDDVRALEAHQSMLTEMNAAALDLAGSLAASDRYERLLKRLARALDADCVALFRVEGQALVTLATCGRAALPASLEIAGELATDLASEGAVSRALDPLWPSAGSSLRVPLRIGDSVVGLLALASARSGAHAGMDAERIRGFAALAAASMRTARLVDELEAALEHRRRVSRELLRQAHLRTSGPLLGQSHAVRRLRDEISAKAAADAHLLILGAPGAGCEAAARALHAESPRSDRPFLMANCALVGSLDEVFGADEDGDRQRLAEGGTLYLSGVNRLSAALQEAVARRIADNPSTRVLASAFEDPQGGSGPAVLQRALEAAFGARLQVPSLRKRKEDIPELADFFLRLHAASAGRMVDPLDPESVDRLRAYDWPGNVEELNLVMQRAVATARGRSVELPAALLEAATEFGGYRLQEPLGSGGMGEVWRAEHRHLARPAAVKLIRQLGHGPEAQAAVARFKREAGVTARLSSPHTVELYDFGVSEGGTFFYVMELLRGMDLQTMVSTFGPLPPERIVRLLIQVCRSLEEAHALGLVHRDIKPANLLSCRLGAEFDFLKVLDFGMVTALPDEDTALTQPGGLAGTPGYLAPECIESGAELDGRADLYSLGCVAFWLASGQPVFSERSSMATLFAHVRKAPPPLRSVAPEVPEAFEAIVADCLEKSPAERPQSAAELLHRLEAVSLERPWTDARAEAWWRTYLPGLATHEGHPRSTSPTAPTAF